MALTHLACSCALSRACGHTGDYPSTSRVAAEYEPHDCVPDGPWALYSVSVYWAVMTITSIGYGDVHAADKNITEQR